MSDTQKPAEVPKETAPATEPVAAPTEATTVPEPTVEAAAAAPETATTTEPTAATETPAAEAETAAAPAAEEAKKEVTPVEEGHLESKGTRFPQNFLYTKRFFWFGTDAVEAKILTPHVKAHDIVAWASSTGKGLLFYTEKGTDKTAPHGAVQLSEASEPTVDGPQKFHFIAKGHKHTFKAANLSERDNWVAQLKLKIAEAKELVATVTESDTYKATIESFKPAPPVKKVEEKKEEAKAEETTAATAAATEETPKEPEAPKPEEAVAAPAAAETPVKEEPKRRSGSRKRASIFGSFLGKKDEEKKPEKKEEAKTEEATAAIAADPVEAAAPAETPATPEAAAPAATETPATTEAVTAPAAEEKPAEKPAPTKRASIFGQLGFGKKKHEQPAAAGEASSPAVPAKDTPAEVAPVSETAPVIPAVETTAPLSTDVSSPANVPVETTEAAVPATNGETKKEVKSDKRKSSLPFGIGKKEKTTSSDEEGEKPKSPSAFSKLRATIKGKAKAHEKPAEKATEKTEDKPAEAEASKAAEETTTEPAKPAEAETTAAPVVDETPKPVTTAPVVAATA